MTTHEKRPRTENVDPAEIEKFSDLAARWWDRESEFRPLHEINPLRLEFINRRTPLANQKVLDVGCGGGILSESMAEKGADVTAIDMAEAPLGVARLHSLESGISIDYCRTTAEQLSQETPAYWDIVTCLEMLEHVPDPASVVDACSRLVKPGGAVYFSTINRNFKAFVMAIVGAEYVLKLLPKGTHQYEKLIKPSELTRWCEQSDLSIEVLTGLHYNPLFKSYRLGGSVDVNYLMYTVKN